LLEEGIGEVRVLDNLTRGTRANLVGPLSDPRFILLEGDIRDTATVRQAVAGCDYVFHQAAFRINQCATQPRDCLDVLVMGTFNVFEAAAAAGVRKLVYASSASVYGGAETFPTDEKHHPYNNRTLYGASKLMDEGIARHFHDMNGFASVGLRYFNVYGPRMDVAGAYTEVFIRWLECIERGIAPQIHGDGSASMDLVYVEDVARANLLAMQSDQADRVYNIASGMETSLLELWHALQQVTGAFHLAPEFHPPRKLNPVPRRLADTSRAWEELGFRTNVTLEEGLKRMAAWRQEALGKCEAVSA
jgi:UDP-glucose 4-epimerase